MDVLVTVDARPAHHHRRPYPRPPGPVGIDLIELDAVEGNVALPAQPDCRGFQQAGEWAAVGLVAIEAILHDGRVLKKERTPVLGVTIKAQFLVANSLYELRRRSAVRVVATRAAHFSLALGMMRKFPLRGNLLFMTGFAGILDG